MQRSDGAVIILVVGSTYRPQGVVESLRGHCTVSCVSHEARLYVAACIYIACKSANPDEGTVNDMKKDLADNGLDFSQLVRWDNKQCHHVQFA
jgi:hypothetical protein